MALWCSPGEMRACWPATAASEVASSSGWFLLRLMSHGQWAALRERLAAEVDTLNYQACRAIAQELQLSYTQARCHSLDSIWGDELVTEVEPDAGEQWWCAIFPTALPAVQAHFWIFALLQGTAKQQYTLSVIYLYYCMLDTDCVSGLLIGTAAEAPVPHEGPPRTPQDRRRAAACPAARKQGVLHASYAGLTMICTSRHSQHCWALQAQSCV